MKKQEALSFALAMGDAIGKRECRLCFPLAVPFQVHGDWIHSLNSLGSFASFGSFFSFYFLCSFVWSGERKKTNYSEQAYYSRIYAENEGESCVFFFSSNDAKAIETDGFVFTFAAQNAAQQRMRRLNNNNHNVSIRNARVCRPREWPLFVYGVPVGCSRGCTRTRPVTKDRIAFGVFDVAWMWMPWCFMLEGRS